MSLDLLREFGLQGQEPHDGLWTGTVGQRLEDKEDLNDDDFGDFEVPDDPNPALKQDSSGIEKQGPSADVSAVGELVDLSDGSFVHTPSSSFKERATDTKPGDPKSLLERRPEVFEKSTSVLETHSGNLPTSTKALRYLKPEADLSSEKSSAFEELEDEDWDDFVEHSIPPAADERSTLHGTVPIENVYPKQRFTQSSGSLGSPLGLFEKNANSIVGPDSSEAMKSSRASKIGHLKPAPSNIPPPSILLLLVENLFQCLPTDTKKIISLTDTSDRSKVDMLQFHMSMVRAAARIIAGRKLRWKRDTHLSQSMKIGPAHSGKTGGMKLTGVDRTEIVREDREVAEALSIWRKQLGGFRAAITMAKTNLGITVPFIPDISGNMPVRGAKLEDGALTAYKSCFLCGLKRDERLERIDVDVQDSFGEWWTDHWGHVDCRIFWEKHQVSLEQRR